LHGCFAVFLCELTDYLVGFMCRCGNGVYCLFLTVNVSFDIFDVLNILSCSSSSGFDCSDTGKSRLGYAISEPEKILGRTLL
jgi:hypothetical protein